jgi:methionine-rich copper-binding protein CopC
MGVSVYRMAGAVLLLLLGVSAAQGHARLLNAEPAAQSTGAAPVKIQLHFSEELAKKFSSFKLADASGVTVLLTPADSADPKSLAASPATALMPGQYTVTWTAVASDDGHKTSGTYVFSVK